MNPVRVETPISPEAIAGLHVGDFLEISGVIYAGRDAVLPKIVAMSDAELAAMRKTLFDNPLPLN